MMIHGQLGGRGMGAMRTDRNANPIAAAVRAGGTNAYTRALDQAGILWTWGDSFPGDPSMVTIKILGDPVAGARAILALSPAVQDWYVNHTGASILSQYGVSSNAQFAALPTDQQNAIIAGIYKAEGGSGELMAGGYSLSTAGGSASPLTPSAADLAAPVDYSLIVNSAGTEDGAEQQEFSGVDGVGLSGTAIALLVAAAVVGVAAFT